MIYKNIQHQLRNNNFIFKNFQVLDSTMEKTKELIDNYNSNFLVLSDEQTKGKGRRGNIWYSPSGNIYISLGFKNLIDIKNHFIFNAATVLSISESIDSICNLNSNIKWPNDILVNNKKIAGILINNIISKDLISYSVIGIGLNVNQHVFNKYIPMATSIFLETGLQNNIEEIQYKLLEQIKFDIVNYFQSKNISSKYLDFLYRINKVSFFESGSQKFNGIIRGVEDSGLLIVETENEIIKFNIKEIKILF